MLSSHEMRNASLHTKESLISLIFSFDNLLQRTCLGSVATVCAICTVVRTIYLLCTHEKGDGVGIIHTSLVNLDCMY